jgi:hypothetical protein
VPFYSIVLLSNLKRYFKLSGETYEAVRIWLDLELLAFMMKTATPVQDRTLQS